MLRLWGRRRPVRLSLLTVPQQLLRLLMQMLRLLMQMLLLPCQGRSASLAGRWPVRHQQDQLQEAARLQQPRSLVTFLLAFRQTTWQHYSRTTTTPRCWLLAQQ